MCASSLETWGCCRWRNPSLERGSLPCARPCRELDAVCASSLETWVCCRPCRRNPSLERGSLPCAQPCKLLGFVAVCASSLETWVCCRRRNPSLERGSLPCAQPWPCVHCLDQVMFWTLRGGRDGNPDSADDRCRIPLGIFTLATQHVHVCVCVWTTRRHPKCSSRKTSTKCTVRRLQKNAQSGDTQKCTIR